MRFDADAVVPFPRERVFPAYRDELDRAVPHMALVKAIDTTLREEVRPGVRRYVRVWTGGGALPAVLRPFLQGDALRWDDDVVWDSHTHTGTWTIRTHDFPTAIDVRGETRFVALGERTRVELRGDFVFDPSRMSALPPAVLTPIARAIEGFFSRQITHNLATTAESITRYLEESSLR